MSIVNIRYEVEQNIYNKYYNVVKYGTVIEVLANTILHINPKRNIKGAYCNYIHVPMFI